MILGIGSGSTIVFAIRKLQEEMSAGGLHDLKFVPTSLQSKYELASSPSTRPFLVDFSHYLELDLCMDGADLVDESLNLVKGGGGCHVQEKIVAYNSKKLCIIADFSKRTQNLGGGSRCKVPVEVLEYAVNPVIKHIERLTKGKAEIRQAKNKAGPVITDNGNLILDVVFEHALDSTEVEKVDQILCTIPGVLGTGLFPRSMVDKVYYGEKDGSVLVIDNPDKQ